MLHGSLSGADTVACMCVCVTGMMVVVGVAMMVVACRYPEAIKHGKIVIGGTCDTVGVGQSQILTWPPCFQNGAKTEFEMCFGSQHLEFWGQNTSRIQNKEVYATLYLQVGGCWLSGCYGGQYSLT